MPFCARGQEIEELEFVEVVEETSRNTESEEKLKKLLNGPTRIEVDLKKFKSEIEILKKENNELFLELSCQS